ncbi:MAG: response regulator, partial [Porticoccaceae bacterium]|nr:response regulator [Porticoccaceae bacterium]
MTNQTILIIDDEAAIRDMVNIALEVAGFDCLQAENARDGHALIIDEKPDLVLLDWMMPVTSG